jgi:SAM-dependent methyltransferase
MTKKILNRFLKKTRRTRDDLLNKTERLVNGLGSSRKCYICGKTFDHFTKFRDGLKGLSNFHKKLDIVGSDVDNFGCMYCGCNDRERHLFMFFDKLLIWENMANKRILHFAPEKHMAIKISEQTPLEYIQADLYPKNQNTQKIDATEIPYRNVTFDFLIANHILEHIPNYRKALSEFYRILKPGGVAILQTPYSKLLKNNFEDDGINSDELRLYFHGQEDHVRTFGENEFLKSIKEAGFNLQIKKHDDYFDAHTAYYYGVPIKEDFIMIEKPVFKQ